METRLRAALLSWLAADPALAALNAVEEESPLKASLPWLGISASASAEWGSKDRAGREVRIALELATRGDDPAGDASLVSAIEARIEAMPHMQDGFDLITARFIRARAERRNRNTRAFLLEYRFRILSNPTE